MEIAVCDPCAAMSCEVEWDGSSSVNLRPRLREVSRTGSVKPVAAVNRCKIGKPIFDSAGRKRTTTSPDWHALVHQLVQPASHMVRRAVYKSPPRQSNVDVTMNSLRADDTAQAGL